MYQKVDKDLCGKNPQGLGFTSIVHAHKAETMKIFIAFALSDNNNKIFIVFASSD